MFPEHKQLLWNLSWIFQKSNIPLRNLSLQGLGPYLLNIQKGTWKTLATSVKLIFKKFYPNASNPIFKENRVRNNNLPLANVVEGEDIIIAVISEINLMTNVSKFVVDTSVTKHIFANRNVFTSYTSVGYGEEHVYLSDSKTTPVIGKRLVRHLNNL